MTSSSISGRQKKPRSGPFNSYIYNNTIYVKDGQKPCFSISPTTKGVLVANNVFHLLGETRVVAGDQKKYKKTKSKASGIIFENNVYVRVNLLPPGLGVKDKRPIIGNADFKKPGGTSPEDYIPANTKMLKDKGIKITTLPGDKIGLSIGFDVKEDFFGNPIQGKPDIGAVEFKQ